MPCPPLCARGRSRPCPGLLNFIAPATSAFLQGASQPEELVARAKALGYPALALTDECSLSGAVLAHLEAERLPMRLIIGATMQVSPHPKASKPAKPVKAAKTSLAPTPPRG